MYKVHFEPEREYFEMRLPSFFDKHMDHLYDLYNEYNGEKWTITNNTIPKEIIENSIIELKRRFAKIHYYLKVNYHTEQFRESQRQKSKTYYYENKEKKQNKYYM